MYPYKRSRKTLAFMLIVSFLGSIFLSAWTINPKSARAYYPPEELSLRNQSRSVQYQISGEAPVEPAPNATGEANTSVNAASSDALLQPDEALPLSALIPPPDNKEYQIDGSMALDVYVAGRNDDAEQRVSDGRMYLTSNDLELVIDPGVTKGNQAIGMRFTGISIPKGSTITQAYIEFQVSEASGESTTVTLRGQAINNAGAFTKTAYNISNRAKTTAAVSWSNIPAWTSVGAKVQTPDLSGVIQEIVNRNGWVSGNSLAIIVEGNGRRIAAAFEASSLNPAMLHIVYSPPISTATPTPPPFPTTTPTQPPMPTATPSPTPTVPPGSDPTPVGQSGDWILKFDDEFNGGSLDTSKWRTCFWWADTTCSIETNHEMELYNPQDVLVQNGLLRLRAQKRDMVAWNGTTYHYTSGMVMTGGRDGQIPPGFTFIYGFVEALVKIPAGQGLWPAFWTLSADYQWPPEIDIMEILGHAPTDYHMNYHYNGGDAGSTWTGPDFSAGWHVIGLDWRPDAIIWFVDGIERWRFDTASKIINEASYLLLNLAVGGDWPGPPNNNTPFPSYFDIDYVRVWQRP